MSFFLKINLHIRHQFLINSFLRKCKCSYKLDQPCAIGVNKLNTFVILTSTETRTKSGTVRMMCDEKQS